MFSILRIVFMIILLLPAGPGQAQQAQQAQQAEQIALGALAGRASEFGLNAADISQITVSDNYRSRHNGVRHIWLQQFHQGLPVFPGLANVNIASDGRVLSVHSRMSADAAARNASREPELSAADAVGIYARERNLDLSVMPVLSKRVSDESLLFSPGSMARSEIPAQLSWLEHKNGLRLVWNLAVEEKPGPDWFDVFIDAHSGEKLLAVNWTQHASYRVFSDPLEHPGQGEDQLVVDPQDPVASPLAWHDDGLNTFTDTRGNNVLAQEDTAANNTGGRRPDGGEALVFDFPVDLDTQQPPQYEEFAVTNLFFWNNRIHDILWHHGFDEAAGNFQQNNFDRGGAGGDPVRADAQDGSGQNNANFSTPPEGIAPRMQMFVWPGSPSEILRVDPPAAASGDYIVRPANFGGAIDMTGVSGVLEPVDDGSADSELGCESLQGFGSGNIALVRRGTCEFGTKALNAQQAGASAVVVVNNDGGNGTIAMGGGADGDQVTIPAAMIGNNDGDLIISELDGSVTGRVFLPSGGNLDRDSDLDAGVIAHEYGHGLSIRLTGGPSNSSCLGGSQQAGEGWSDFLGLWVSAKADDELDAPRGIGSYLLFQENFPGAGIRPAPYTRNMALNDLVYESVRAPGISVPHGVGTVFNSALWDMYLNLVEKHGFDANLTTGSGGNNLALRLVIDGLKLQPCNPTFLDTRDAMLLADEISNDGDNQCEIWDAFSRRGMGLDAGDGGSSDSLNVSNGFALPEQCEGQVELIFANGFE